MEKHMEDEMEIGFYSSLYELLSALAFLVALNSGHGGSLLQFSIAPNIVPNKEPVSINFGGNIDCR